LPPWLLPLLLSEMARNYANATFGLVQIAEDFSDKEKDTSTAPKTTETPS